MWCVPTLDDEYKARMYDLLDLYERSYDPFEPVVCLDEKSVELHDELSEPVKKKYRRLTKSNAKNIGELELYS